MSEIHLHSMILIRCCHLAVQPPAKHLPTSLTSGSAFFVADNNSFSVSSHFAIAEKCSFSSHSELSVHFFELERYCQVQHTARFGLLRRFLELDVLVSTVSSEHSATFFQVEPFCVLALPPWPRSPTAPHGCWTSGVISCAPI